MPVNEAEYLELIKEQAEIKGQLHVHSNSLKAGAESFGELRKSVHELAGRPLKPLHLFGIVFGPLLAIGSVVWAASRYPERAEFETLDSKVRSMEINQVETKRDIADINRAMTEANRKLDKLLDVKP